MPSGKTIVYVERSGFYYQGDGAATLSFAFPPDTVTNLEVLSRERLELLIRTFIQNNKLAPSIVIIVLGQSVYFEKDIVEGDESQQEIEMQQFLDNVPFEFVISKSFPLEKGQKVIAANKDLCKPIKTAFEKEGHAVVSVVPVATFGTGIDSFSQNTANVILARFEAARHANILEEREIIANAPNEPPTKKQQQKNNMLLVLFIVLAAIAGFLIYYSVALQPK